MEFFIMLSHFNQLFSAPSVPAFFIGYSGMDQHQLHMEADIRQILWSAGITLMLLFASRRMQ